MVAIVYEEVLFAFVFSQDLAMGDLKIGLAVFDFGEVAVFVELNDHVLSLCCVEEAEAFCRVVDYIAEFSFVWNLISGGSYLLGVNFIFLTSPWLWMLYL